VVHVAVDLLGGPGAPQAPFGGIRHALDADPALRVSAVGPAQLGADLLGLIAAGDRSRVCTVEAGYGIPPAADAAREVRARRDATVRVAAKLVRDGRADAIVSAAPADVLIAAARFTMGLLPGATRPVLAARLGTSGGEVVLVDAGAAPEAGPDELTQCAVLGSACAAAAIGAGAIGAGAIAQARPRVGLLAAGRTGWDGPRQQADDLIARLHPRYVGGIEADAIITGNEIDVVVSDGFTGAVLISCLDGAARASGQPVVYPRKGTIVVGVNGIAVSAYGGPIAGSADGGAIAGAIEVAAKAVRAGLLSQQRSALADLVASRRARAGLTS
jgi:glycerol-3-phosphate acyltransferase PlsX